MRFREAEEHVKGRWGELVLEMINERVTREQQALKAELEKTKITVLEQILRQGPRQTPQTQSIPQKCLRIRRQGPMRAHATNVTLELDFIKLAKQFPGVAPTHTP